MATLVDAGPAPGGFRLPGRLLALGLTVAWAAAALLTAGQREGHAELLAPTAVALLALMAGALLLPADLRAAVPGLMVVGYLALATAVQPFVLPVVEAATRFAGRPLETAPEVWTRAAWVGAVAAVGSAAALLCRRLGRRRWALGWPPAGEPGPDTEAYRRFGLALAGAIAVLMPAVNTLAVALGVGFHGGPPSELPFRLGGIITAVRSEVGFVCLLVILCGYRARRRRLVLLGFLLLGANAVILALLSSSRGVFMSTAMSAGFMLLFLVRRIAMARTLVAVVVVVVATGALWPVLSLYRSVGIQAGVLEAYRVALDQVGDAELAAVVLLEGPAAVAARFAGIAQVVPILEHDVAPGWDTTGRVLSEGRTLFAYYNQDVLGLPPDAMTATSPTLIGWLYLGGGLTAVAAGMFAFTYGAQLAWWLAHRLRLQARPLILAYLGSLLFELLVGGTVEAMFTLKEASQIAVNIVGIEVLVRLTTRTRRPEAVAA